MAEGYLQKPLYPYSPANKAYVDASQKTAVNDLADKLLDIVKHQQGPQGEKGEPGPPGRDGKDGKNGRDGRDGKQGPKGEPGKNGKDGAQGPQGEKGDKGEPGLMGLPGLQGAPGKDGKPGKKGADGKAGKDGKDGKDGKPGPRGHAGPRGDKGLPGVGVPSGGTTGQVLKKKSNDNFDTEWAAESGGSGGVSDGDKGDITVSSGGTVWTIDNNVIDGDNIIDGEISTGKLADDAVTTNKLSNSSVTYAKIQDVSTNNRLLGRSTTGAGVVEEITVGSGLTLSGGTLSASGGSGEANTASNVGTGAGVFKQKTSVDLEFKSIRSSDGTVSITGNTNDIDITASLAQLNGFTYVGWTTYSGSITWTGTTAPSGATNHEYQYSSLGGVVNLWIRLEYANAGSALTVVQMALPSGVPTPQRPAAVGANERYIGAAGYLATANNADGAASRAIMHYNGTNDLIRIIAASGSYRVAYVHICYLS